MGRDFLFKLFPISFLLIGSFLGGLPLLLDIGNNVNVNWNVYLMLQMLVWSTLGIIMKNLYISSNKDELTKLWNRRYIHNKLSHELNRLKENSTLSLAIIDIDNFKHVNDTQGHLFGDEVLKRLAGILQMNVRNNDSVGRWGGEEFIIILPYTDKVGAKALVDRIRRIVEGYDFGYKITISVGIAATDVPTTVDRLVGMADKALYQAKKTKNMVAIYSSCFKMNQPN